MTRSDSNISVRSPLGHVHPAGRADERKPPFSSILVDVDTTAKSQPALTLAAILARKSGAQLRIVDASKESGDLVWGTGGATGFAISTFGVSRAGTRPPHDVLIQEVKRFGHDLVIRSQERDSVATSAMRQYSVNNRLFRHCPCPVWTVGVRPNLNHPRILVAVNPASVHADAKTLDAGAIRFAFVISSLLGGEITVFYAWHQPAEKKLYVHLTEAEVQSCVRSTERQAADDLMQLVDSFGQSMTGSRIELRRGVVEEIIPAFVVSEGIDIVITRAPIEAGIWPLLFGSTAERLLKTTPCSVIAYKLAPRCERVCAAASPEG